MDEQEWLEWMSGRRTEAHWLTSLSPRELVYIAAENKVSRRKLYLFGCACCRRLWDVLTDPRSRSAVEFIERVAEGEADETDFPSFAALALTAREEVSNGSFFAAEAVSAFCRPGPACSPHVPQALAWARGETIGYGKPGYDAAVEKEYSEQTALLRCVMGNPFRPVSLDPAWRTPSVLTLAEATYENRILPSGHLEPDRLGVLTDALEEAGCDNADILDHFRGSGPHYRGCWALDLILGKE
jgi:hypothetical protein